MGEIADAIIDGEFDMYTCEYLGPGVGYPRTRERTENFNNVDMKYGIFKYLSGIVTRTQRREILLSFHPGSTEQMSNETLCVYASNNFKEFKKHVQQYIESRKEKK